MPRFKMTNTRRSSSSSTPADPPNTPPSKVKVLVRSTRKEDSPHRPSFINSNSIVTVFITQDGNTTVFSVHKTYLITFSHYFRAALNGSFTEAETLKFQFTDISPNVFDIFVSWAYTQKIVDSAGNPPILRNLIDLWLLADRFQVPRLQNEALEAMNRQASQLNRAYGISFFHVYENTVDESPLRLFLAALSSQALMKEGKMISDLEEYPHQMLVDMFNWAATHHKKLAKFAQSDLEKFYVSQDESSPPLQTVRSLTSTSSPISPSNSFSGGSTFAAGF